MPSSFFSKSAFKGPTPFKYSIGLSNIEGEAVIDKVYSKNKGKRSLRLGIKDAPILNSFGKAGKKFFWCSGICFSWRHRETVQKLEIYFISQESFE